MVMMVEPIVAAVEDIRNVDGRVVLMTPQGVPFTQARASELAKHRNLILICGRYEGVDERVRTLIADEEISIGDYVLSGGEVAAMVVIDAVARLLPGVVGDAASLEGESYGTGRLAYPQFTRPEEFREQRVPPVLLSGHHGRIDRWRRAQMLHRTRQRRPDLLPDECLSAEDWTLIREIPASEDEDSL
jgi:tRNA (guanine37-N1)-methyltransferase